MIAMADSLDRVQPGSIDQFPSKIPDFQPKMLKIFLPRLTSLIKEELRRGEKLLVRVSANYGILVGLTCLGGCDTVQL